MLRWLIEMLAEFFRPLLCPLPRHAYLPLFYAFLVVGNVPQFPELSACLCVQYGRKRFFYGLPTPLGVGLRLAHQDLVRHLRYRLLRLQNLLLLTGVPSLSPRFLS